MRVQFMTGINRNAPIVEWEGQLYASMPLDGSDVGEHSGNRYVVRRLHEPGSNFNPHGDYWIAVLDFVGR